ncbi:MAG: S9 family peptidase [Gemmatimonadales bacterium]|jgi:dipeptidyl aminopeptidase/acylaminoacyl peptidase
MTRTCVLTLAVMLAATACQPAARQTEEMPPVIPLTEFFDNPEIAGAQISPDGDYLSYLKPYEGKLNLYVRRFDSQDERLMTRDTVRPIMSYQWSVDGDQLLYLQDRGGNENFHVYSVPVEGEGDPQARDLTPFEGVRAFILDVPRERPGEILVALNRRNPRLFDAYWLDIESGDLTLVVENPGNFGGMLADDENQVRVAIGQGPAGESIIYYRESEDADWQEVASYPAQETASPIRFHPDARHLYMATNHGDTDLTGLALLDLDDGELEWVERDPENEADLAGAVFSEVTDSLLATVYEGDTVRIYPKTGLARKVIGDLREIHDGNPNITSMTLDEKAMVVSYDSPTDPGATYRYDSESGDSEFLFRPRPWLEPTQLAGMRPIQFTARDGMTIHGYLTTPVGVEARDLPMVLYVHGGPWARDDWGYDPVAQLLANRGYAVLQVNYRGSTGYGKAFYNAAVKEFAGKMHDDLIDGVSWAIGQGIADSTRVGIHGGSYGGYATLVGMTFTPEYFACGVDYVGPSSLITLIESFPPYWRPFLEGSWFRFVGDPADPEVREDLKTRSPLFHIDQIEDPLMVVQGANDPRVTKLESDQLVVALRDRGITTRYLVAPNEGHGFANADNRLALYRSMEEFFGECLGGRVQEDVDPAIAAKIAELTVDVDTLSLPASATESE